MPVPGRSLQEPITREASPPAAVAGTGGSRGAATRELAPAPAPALLLGGGQRFGTRRSRTRRSGRCRCPPAPGDACARRQQRRRAGLWELILDSAKQPPSVWIRHSSPPKCSVSGPKQPASAFFFFFQSRGGRERCFGPDACFGSLWLGARCVLLSARQGRGRKEHPITQSDWSVCNAPSERMGRELGGQVLASVAAGKVF